MRILVLNGSPKRDKSDTMHITRAFLEGMRDAAPQEIHEIDVIDRHIEYCTGCFACKRNGGTCIHDDDMRAILDEILDSDLLLFSFPLYCYGTALMTAVEARAAAIGYRRLVLECREGNAAAIGFYRRLGYAVCEKYPPYCDEKDAVCMEKPLLCDTERRKETQPDGSGEVADHPG